MLRQQAGSVRRRVREQHRSAPPSRLERGHLLLHAIGVDMPSMIASTICADLACSILASSAFQASLFTRRRAVQPVGLLGVGRACLGRELGCIIRSLSAAEDSRLRARRARMVRRLPQVPLLRAVEQPKWSAPMHRIAAAAAAAEIRPESSERGRRCRSGDCARGARTASVTFAYCSAISACRALTACQSSSSTMRSSGTSVVIQADSRVEARDALAGRRDP